MFKNKVVIVTGASSDVGQTISIKFAREGANVVLVGRNEEKLKKVKTLCDDVGTPAFIIKADITVDDEAKNVIEGTVKKFKKLDVLVNNAGIKRIGNLYDASILESFDDVMNTNVRAVVYLTSLATKHIVASKGNIVNVTSIGANRAVKDHSAYSMSHAAVNHFTRLAAVELGEEGVRVNSVGSVISHSYQGSVLSTLLEEYADEEEIADVVLFIANGDNDGIVGSNYTCDSGALACS